MKLITINTPAGQYEIPAIKVAEHRADYYICEVEKLDKNSQEYKDEVNFLLLNDDYEIIDWLINNSDWEDWENIAVKINDNVLVLKDDFWTNSDDFTIKENK